jgi:multiple antibiotic resistance protein
MFESFVKAFIPLFVAMDTLGLLPLFLGLTQGMEPAGLRKLIVNATLAALIISIIFLFTGSAMFDFLGITSQDFRIGGGILLLVLAIQDLTSSTSQEQHRGPANCDIGVVPIGIPLIMGPAALTTILILVEEHGVIVTLSSLLANFVLVLVVLMNSRYIIKVLGEAGSKAFAKVAALLMAGIAVMMIRSGIEAALGR